MHYIHSSQVRNAVYECVWCNAGNSLTPSLIMSATSKSQMLIFFLPHQSHLNSTYRIHRFPGEGRLVLNHRPSYMELVLHIQQDQKTHDMCPLLQEREQTLRKDYIQTTQCTVKTSSQRTFKQKSGTHTSIASFLTSILPGAQGGVEKDVRKKLIVCRKSQVMKRLAYQTMTWTRSFRNLSCVVTCVQWIAKKIEENPKQGR